jgi:hypothetical protein
MTEMVGEYVDRLCTVEMRMAGGVPRGLIPLLQHAARKLHGCPLTLLVAERLKEAYQGGGNVLISTGLGLPPWLAHGETDGPRPGMVQFDQ